MIEVNEMKRDLIKTNERKTLHKVKKNWIIVTAAAFTVLGAGMMLQTTPLKASAAEIQANTVSASSAADTVQSGAAATASSASVSSASVSSAVDSNSSSAQSVSSASNSISSAASSSASVASSDSNVEQVKWGTANATYDKNTKTLTVNSGDNNSVGVLPQDGTAGDINFKADVEKLVIAKPVKLAANAQWVFGNFVNLKDIEGLSNVDASAAVYMDGLFAQDKYLTSIDISNWKTSNVVSMNSMFMGTKSAKTINVTGIDTSKVQDMYAMFSYNYELTKVIGINNLDYSNVTNMAYWFAEDKSLSSLDLSGVYAPKVTNIDYMFLNTISLLSLNMTSFTSQSLVNAKAFWFQTEDSDFNFENRNDPNIIVSHLVSFITGPKFDTFQVLFESFGGNRKSHKIGSDGLIFQVDWNQYTSQIDNNTAHYSDYIKDLATKLWRAKMVRFIDAANGQQIGDTVLAQGMAGKVTEVPLPSGYQLLEPNSNDISYNGSESTDTVVYIKVGKPIRFTVNLVDSDNNIVATSTINSVAGTTYNASSLLPMGYNFTGASTVIPTANDQTFNISVDTDKVIDKHKNNDAKPKNSQIGERLFLVKGLYRYSTPYFNKKNRVQGYRKYKRPNAQMFKIIGVVTNKNGYKRYKVMEISNKTFKTNPKKVGYITAKKSYTKPLFYQKDVRKVGVIAKKVRSYKDIKLSKAIKSYKQGTVLKVKSVRKLGEVYRLQLSNNHFVSANKNLVQLIK